MTDRAASPTGATDAFEQAYAGRRAPIGADAQGWGSAMKQGLDNRSMNMAQAPTAMSAQNASHEASGVCRVVTLWPQRQWACRRGCRRAGWLLA